jgi:hypothetical protein
LPMQCARARFLGEVVKTSQVMDSMKAARASTRGKGGWWQSDVRLECVSVSAVLSACKGGSGCNRRHIAGAQEQVHAAATTCQHSDGLTRQPAELAVLTQKLVSLTQESKGCQDTQDCLQAHTKQQQQTCVSIVAMPATETAWHCIGCSMS